MWSVLKAYDMYHLLLKRTHCSAQKNRPLVLLLGGINSGVDNEEPETPDPKKTVSKSVNDYLHDVIDKYNQMSAQPSSKSLNDSEVKVIQYI